MNIEIVLQSVNEANPAIDTLNSSIEAIQRLINDLTSAFNNFSTTAQTSMTTAKEAVDKLLTPLNDDINKANDLAENISKIGEDAQTSMTTAKEAVEGLTTPLKDDITSINDMGKAFQSMSKEAESAALKAEEAMAGVGKAKGISEEAGGGEKAPNGILSMEGQMNNLYAGMTLSAISAPMDAGISSAVKSFSDFDQSMRLVNQEMKLGEDGFKGLEGSIVKMSNETGISADQLAQGLYNVVATGTTDVNDAMNLLRTSADGAKAGHTDLDTATRSLNAVMGAYGLTAKDASSIMDIMFTSVNNGQMHFDDLARSVGASATSAATAGVKYEELSAAQATLTNVGKNAESASQNLNSLIIGMLAPTKRSQDEAKKLGIEWDASALKAHGLSYMVNEAMQATKGNSDELKKLIPNQRAYIAELALGGSAHEQYTKTLEQMKNSTGATSQALQEYDKGAGESLEKTKTKIQNMGIELANTLAPAIKSVTDAVQKFCEWFDKLSPSTKTCIADTVLLIAGLTTLGATFFLALSGLGALAMAFEALIPIIEGVCAILIVPEALFIAIGVAVVALGVLIYTHWDAIKKFLGEVWAEIEKLATEIWNGIKTFFSTLWQDIKNIASETWEGIKTVLREAWDSIADTVKGFVEGIANFFKWLYNHNYYFKDLVDGIYNNFIWIRDKAKEIWNFIWNDIMLPVYNWLKDTFSAIWDSIKTSIGTAWDNVKESFTTVWNYLKDDLMVPLYDWFKDTFSSVWDKVKIAVIDAWNGIREAVGSIVKDALNWGENLINNIVQGINNKIADVENAAKNVASKISNFLGFHSPAKEGPGSDADTWAPNFIDMYSKGFLDSINKISGAVSKIMQPLQNSFGSNTSENMAYSYGSSMAVSSGSLSNSAPMINVYVSGNIAKNEQELGDMVARAVWKQAKMQGKF